MTLIVRVRLGLVPEYIPEHLYKNSLHLARKYARIFVRGHYLLREANSGRHEEQIMSKDKYPSIFSPQTEAIFFIVLQIFFAMGTVLKIGGYSPVNWSRDAFRPIARKRKDLMDYNPNY